MYVFLMPVSRERNGAMSGPCRHNPRRHIRWRLHKKTSGAFSWRYLF